MAADPAAFVVLLEFEKSYGLGFIAPNGKVVTSFHVVSDESEILVHFSDGRSLPVKSVCALDLKRDLAVLDVGMADVVASKAGGNLLLDEGATGRVFGMVPEEGRARWVNTRIESVQALGPSLTVYRLGGKVPKDASGGPLVTPAGLVLGVVTVAESDEGIVTLVIPWKYVEPLLAVDRGLPLSALSDKRGGASKRDIPAYPLSMLEGSSVTGLQMTTEAIANVIRLGAPAYNDGDVAKCFRLYSDAARQVIAARGDCPGIQTALRDGLKKADALSDVDGQAWVVRDTFDGVLAVIDRFFKAHFGAGQKRGKPTLMN
jgi:serine protease Do